MAHSLKFTGLFFGTYNPIHLGHLEIARYMSGLSEIEEVWLVVSPSNPLKTEDPLLSSAERLVLVQEALAEQKNPKLKACDLEFSLPVPSYTINTLRELTKRFPERRFALIIGMDNLEQLHRWKDADQIISDYPLFVYPRGEGQGERYRHLPGVHFTQAPLIDVSSTEIRARIRKGETVKHLLADLTYISLQKLITNRPSH